MSSARCLRSSLYQPSPSLHSPHRRTQTARASRWTSSSTLTAPSKHSPELVTLGRAAAFALRCLVAPPSQRLRAQRTKLHPARSSPKCPTKSSGLPTSPPGASLRHQPYVQPPVHAHAIVVCFHKSLPTLSLSLSLCSLLQHYLDPLKGSCLPDETIRGWASTGGTGPQLQLCSKECNPKDAFPCPLDVPDGAIGSPKCGE